VHVKEQVQTVKKDIVQEQNSGVCAMKTGE